MENTIFYAINFGFSFIFLLTLTQFLDGNIKGNLPWIAFPILAISANCFVHTFLQILKIKNE